MSLRPLGQAKKSGYYPKLTFISDIQHVIQTGQSRGEHIDDIARVRPSLSLANTEMLVLLLFPVVSTSATPCFLVCPREEFFTSSYFRIQQRVRKRSHITLVLKSFRVKFKVHLMALQCVNGLAPSYLLELLLASEPP